MTDFTSEPPGNGLWEPKAAKVATAEAAKPASAQVESPSGELRDATMLNARPARPPSSPPPSGGGGGGGGGGTDMRATFAKLRTCGECISAGYGWCTIQRKCGGFAARECGEGERYVSVGYDGGAKAVAAPAEAEAEEEAEAEAGEEAAEADDAFGDLPTVKWGTFKREVMDFDGIVAIQFYAPWCGHCKAMKPAWRTAIAELGGAAKLLVVDATVEQKLAKRFEVQGYPTIKLFGRNKRAVPTDYTGARTADALVARLREVIADGASAPPTATPKSKSKPPPSTSTPPPSPPPPPPPKRGPPPAMPRMLRRHELQAMAPKVLVDKVLELQDELKAWYEL